MSIANISEPVYLVPILEQTQRNTVHRRVTPPLIEESTGSVKVLEVFRVSLGSPKSQRPDLKVRPEMARAVAVRLGVVIRSVHRVRDPADCVIRVQILCRVVAVREELLRFGPQSRDTERRIVYVDCETVCFVVILHISEDVVVHVAEELDLWLNSPIIIHIFQRRVLWE